MSYLFYMTYHYQHGGNDHANASKFMKCSKPYQYKKPPLNQRAHKMNRTIALTMISLTAGNCS